MYRTVIIEDDPVITQLNRQYVEKDSRFTVVQTFSAAHPALFWLRNNLVDLIILDMYMPQMSGLELLRILRAEGVNYLIKPFGYERFQLALKNFCDHWDTIHQDPNHPHKFTQNQLDNVLLHFTASSPPPAPGGMPKGLQSQTLTLLQDYLKENPQGHTCDDIASHVGLSVDTVRRYMNYLAEQHLVDSDMDYNTGGRPCIVYKLKP